MTFNKQNMKPNDVKGVKSTSEERHVVQVSPDSYPVTVSINGVKGDELLGIDPLPN